MESSNKDHIHGVVGIIEILQGVALEIMSRGNAGTTHNWRWCLQFNDVPSNIIEFPVRKNSVTKLFVTGKVPPTQ